METDRSGDEDGDLLPTEFLVESCYTLRTTSSSPSETEDVGQQRPTLQVALAIRSFESAPGDSAGAVPEYAQKPINLFNCDALGEVCEKLWQVPNSFVLRA